MSATKLIIATLALTAGLSRLAAAQSPGLEEPLPAVDDVRVLFERTGSIDIYVEQPAGTPGGTVDTVEEPHLLLNPGTSITRCGVTVANLDASATAVVLAPAGPGCFTDILVADGAHAAIDVAADAEGLEVLQVTVMGRAFLDVGGEQGLGQYDPREFATTRAGIVVDGSGLTASDQEQMATITLKSSGNVVETLGASRDHEIRVLGDANLVRLHGADQVHASGLDVRVLWMAPMFLQ